MLMQCAARAPAWSGEGGGAKVQQEGPAARMEPCSLPRDGTNWQKEGACPLNDDPSAGLLYKELLSGPPGQSLPSTSTAMPHSTQLLLLLLTLSASTLWGAGPSLLCPRPNCPFWLRPKLYSSPPSVTTSVCASPHATCTMQRSKQGRWEGNGVSG